MRQRIVPIGLAVVVATALAVWGYNKNNQDSESPTNPRKTSGVESAVQKLRSSKNADDVKSAATALEKALEKEPGNAEGWKHLAAAQVIVAQQPGEEKAGDALCRQALDYLQRSVKADPKVADDGEYRSIAALAHYKVAGALSREKKVAESLVTLQSAIDYGFKDFEQIEKDEDFANIRSAPEFGKMIETVKKAMRAAIDEEITRLLEANNPFEFDFNLKDIAGNRLSKTEMAGKVVIVDLWGTWCPPCRREIPHFVALDRQYRDAGLQVLGFNSEKTADKLEATAIVKEFCGKMDVTYPCAIVTDKIKGQIPRFDGYPTTLFLDRTGKVRLRVVGYHELPFLQAAVERLLNEKPGDAAGE